MSEPLLCKICGFRRSKRHCPAVDGEICTICCGTEREVSLACPLGCEFLQEAHRHEKPLPLPADELSNPDIVVSEELVAEHEELLLFSIYALVQAAVRTSGAIDTDAMEALAALIQTHRTLESGLVYQTVPENTVALAVQRSVSASLADYQKLRAERENRPALRNSEILAILVFLHRIGQQNRSSRPRARLFLDLLSQMTPEARVAESAPRLII